MFEKQLKKLKLLDIALIKLAIAAFVLFVLGIWSVAMDWVKSVNYWYFLAIAVIVAIIVQIRIWK